MFFVFLQCSGRRERKVGGRCNKGTWLAYRICMLQTAASAVGCGWMWSEKLNNRRSDGGMTGDVCYRICTIDRSVIKKNVSLEVVDDVIYSTYSKNWEDIIYDLYATIKYFNLNLSHL